MKMLGGVAIALLAGYALAQQTIPAYEVGRFQISSAGRDAVWMVDTRAGLVLLCQLHAKPRCGRVYPEDK